MIKHLTKKIRAKLKLLILTAALCLRAAALPHRMETRHLMHYATNTVGGVLSLS